MTSSSSSSKSYYLYDVFLSFRGEDTRTSFTSSLYSALTDHNIKTFMDTNLDKGTIIESELFRAIEGSWISIVVFSRRYAGSKWCLDELVKIMECHRDLGQVVVPVFYCVNPAHVRHQIGDFGDAYTQLLRKQRVNDADVLSCWKRALTDASNFSGWPVISDNYGVIKRIAEDIYQKLDHVLLLIPNFPVGLESRAQDVLQYLKEKSSTVCVVGILGMGGSGKTTLAKAIYNAIHRDFVHTSFLADIRELWETNRGRTDLQEQLLNDILKPEKMKVNSIEWGKAMIKRKLCNTRVLVILDDVNKYEQIQALFGDRTWFGPGSVVIITTRDERVLNLVKADHIYETKEMNESESLELFSWNAFRQASPSQDFLALSKNIAAYCEGLPVALEVLGSYLYERSIREWINVDVKRILEELYERLELASLPIPVEK